jgi:hypothetical protein
MRHIDPHLEEEDEDFEDSRHFQSGYESDVDEAGAADDEPVSRSRGGSRVHDAELGPGAREALHQYRVGHRRLNAAIADLVQDYSLVSYRPLSVNDKYAMHRVLADVDKANGYVFAELDLARVELDRFKQSVAEDGPGLQVLEKNKQRK